MSEIEQESDIHSVREADMLNLTGEWEEGEKFPPLQIMFNSPPPLD